MAWPGVSEPDTSQNQSGFRPCFRVSVIAEHPDVGVDKQIRYPGTPGLPLILRDYCNPVEFAAVLPNDLDVLPCHINSVIHHVSPIEQYVHLAVMPELVEYLLFEFLVIGEGKLTKNGDADQIVRFLDSNHGLVSKKHGLFMGTWTVTKRAVRFPAARMHGSAPFHLPSGTDRGHFG